MSPTRSRIWRPRRRDLGIMLSAIAAFIVLATAPFAGPWLREPLFERAVPLPLSFPHSKHVGDTGCATCHHNMKEKSAGQPCIHCHKSNDPGLKRGIEAEFHDFCKGCHADRARSFKKHGPIRECVLCHTATEDGFLP